MCHPFPLYSCLPATQLSHGRSSKPPSPQPHIPPPTLPHRRNHHHQTMSLVLTFSGSYLLSGALFSSGPSTVSLPSPESVDLRHYRPHRHSRGHPRRAHRKLLQQGRAVLISRNFLPAFRLLLYPPIWRVTVIALLDLPLTSYQGD